LSDIKGWLEQIQYIWRRRGTKRGLVALFLLFDLCVAPAGLAVAYFICDKAGLLPSSGAFRQFAAVSSITVAAINGLLLALWLFWRRVPTTRRERIRVFFAPSSQPQCDELVEKLHESFCNDLASRGLGTLIEARLLPHHDLVKDAEGANEFLVRSGGRVVIYGVVDSGQIAGKSVEGFRNIGFGVRHRPLRPEEAQPFVNDLIGAVVERSYLVSEANSFLEYGMVVRNLSEVSRFLVGAALTLDGRRREALAVLRPLYRETCSQLAASPDRIPLQAFRRSVTSFLRSALYYEFDSIYESEVVEHITDPSVAPKVAQCQALIDELGELPGQRWSVGLLQAILAFHRGELSEAERWVRLAQRSLGQHELAPHLSLAFLALWRADNAQALKEYIRAKNCPRFNLKTVTSVVRFLDAIADRHPERRQLRFGVAFVNDHFLDKERASAEYARFLSESDGAPELGLLRDYASQRLSHIADTEIEA